MNPGITVGADRRVRKFRVVTGDDTGEIQIMDVNAKTIESPINIGSPVRDVEINKAGKYAALTSDDGKITILDLRTRQKAGFDLNAIAISALPDSILPVYRLPASQKTV